MTKEFRELQIEFYLNKVEDLSCLVTAFRINDTTLEYIKHYRRLLFLQGRAKRELSRPIKEKQKAFVRALDLSKEIEPIAIGHHDYLKEAISKIVNDINLKFAVMPSDLYCKTCKALRSWGASYGVPVINRTVDGGAELRQDVDILCGHCNTVLTE